MTGLCEVVLESGGKTLAPMYSAKLAQVAGVVLCFTGGADECVKVWDVTSQSCLYELSTGNCHVHNVFWQKDIATLAIIVEDLRQDRLGYHHDYEEDEDDESDEEDTGRGYPWPKRASHQKDDFKQVQYMKLYNKCSTHCT
jgi:hypothetical protein